MFLLVSGVLVEFLPAFHRNIRRIIVVVFITIVALTAIVFVTTPLRIRTIIVGPAGDGFGGLIAVFMIFNGNYQ